MSHFDSDGHAQMVDVSAKPVTVRQATASALINMAATTADVIRSGTAKKGDVLGIARLAAIQGSKLTSQLIPLCHSIPIESVAVDFDWLPPEPAAATISLRCQVHVGTSAKTGVEMEALTAASIASLTVYDMVKSIDRAVSIGPIALLRKSGGKSGEYRRDPS